MNKIELNKIWINNAVLAAKKAADAIMKIYTTNFEVEYKTDASPVTIADKTSSKIILEELSKTGIPIISEEEEIPPYSDRKKNEYTWIVDPLDGTKEFIRKNGEFCICIALIHNNQSVFGLIASPIDKKILLGGSSIGAFYFDFTVESYFSPAYKVTSLKTDTPSKTLAYSRSHFEGKAKDLIDSIQSKYGTLTYIKKGSALKFIDLVLGKADFYPRFAPTMEWDIAAGQAIYEAVGGEVLDFTNFEPLTYNKEDLYNPFFIAKNKELTI